MQKKKILFMLVLLCAIVQGALAQDEWDAVYTMTQTKQSDWTALSAGSTTGRTLGSAGNTTYYYVTSNLSFTNSTAGGDADLHGSQCQRTDWWRCRHRAGGGQLALYSGLRHAERQRRQCGKRSQRRERRCFS